MPSVNTLTHSRCLLLLGCPVTFSPHSWQESFSCPRVVSRVCFKFHQSEPPSPIWQTLSAHLVFFPIRSPLPKTSITEIPSPCYARQSALIWSDASEDRWECEFKTSVHSLTNWHWNGKTLHACSSLCSAVPIDKDNTTNTGSISIVSPQYWYCLLFPYIVNI